MMPLPERPDGVIWIDGVCAVPDEKGVEKLVAHYSRRRVRSMIGVMQLRRNRLLGLEVAAQVA